jgi:hypothetical protein
LKIYI